MPLIQVFKRGKIQMANKSNALNQSEARRVLQEWKIGSGEKVQDIAQKLGIKHNTVSAWFAINSRKPEPMCSGLQSKKRKPAISVIFDRN
uniref:hypothetical protein n=1 Tax=Methylomonas sp. SPW-1 TaxID=3438877 RepID=UPI00402B133A